MIRSFGVEIEYFITDREGAAPDAILLWNFRSALIGLGFAQNPDKSNDEPMDLIWATESLSARLHHDFYSHLIELSFAPTRNVKAFQNCYDGALDALRGAAFAVGLTVHDSAVLSSPPADARFLFQQNKVLFERYKWLESREMSGRPYARRFYYAHAAATHVHVESDVVRDYKMLPYMYEMEYMIPWAFTNSQVCWTEPKAIRPLWMQDSYSDTYWAAGFPAPWPPTFEDYVARLRASGAVRDYSFIAPRPELGTIEFRTADSLPTSRDVLSLVLFRLIALEIAEGRLDQQAHLENIREVREHFRAVCISGRPSSEKVRLDVEIVLERTKLARSKWNGIASQLEERLMRSLGDL
jgi:hypothetical protein